MKYLLILLFLFSTHSFSGEIDGKGIECNATRLDNSISAIQMWWFNNDKVTMVYVNKLDYSRVPNTEILNNKYNSIGVEYTTTADKVVWSVYTGDKYTAYLNRKTLEYTVKERDDTMVVKVIIKGTCRVITGFEEVIRKQDEDIEIYEEEKRKKEEEERKAREGNKI